MHFSTFLVAATALCATSVSGSCFNTGQNWGDHAVAKAQLTEACKDLEGTYTSSEVRQRCRNKPTGGESYNFKIENHTGKDANISQDECEREIGAQIDNCGHGGEVKHANVWFRGDPNKGSC